MDAVRVYDVLTQARQTLFDWVRPLDQAQYTQRFPFGLGSLRLTLVEIAGTELYLAMRLREEPLPPVAHWPISEERQPTFADLERAWEAQSVQTRATLSDVRDWDQVNVARVVRPDKTLVLTATKADLAAQLLMHEVHHRAKRWPCCGSSASLRKTSITSTSGSGARSSLASSHRPPPRGRVSQGPDGR